MLILWVHHSRYDNFVEKDKFVNDFYFYTTENGHQPPREMKKLAARMCEGPLYTQKSVTVKDIWSHKTTSHQLQDSTLHV